jgi:pyruvate dehydrogenase E1 component
MPAGAREGILKGMYRYKAAADTKSKLRAQLFGSGAILREVLHAQEILQEKYHVAADVWSVTSYKALYSDGLEAERWNLLHPTKKPRVPYISKCLADASGVLVAATDYLKALPNLVSRWVPRRLASLGTDGFGRSESRTSLRNFFEVDARFITLATLHELLLEGKIQASVVQQAIKDLEIDVEKADPLTT